MRWWAWLLLPVVGTAMAISLLAPPPQRLLAVRQSKRLRRTTTRLGTRLRSRRRSRWACGLVLSAGLLVLVIWVLPIAMTSHPTITDPADRHKAAADVRAGLIALLVAIGAAGTLAFTARSYRLNREGHITDRYTKAVDQLGHDTLAVRLGGMYALERIAEDSGRDHPTVVEVLSAFVRKTAPATGPNHQLIVAPDADAALTVLGRLPMRPGVNRANIPGAHLEGADLSGARLNGATLAGAHLQGAILIDTHLNGADLSEADLDHADLTAAKIKWAKMSGTLLAGADLTMTQVMGTDLSKSKSLTQSQVQQAAGDSNTQLPPGFTNPWSNQLGG
jgi:Pentapeptide repeats (8 copies)